MKGSGSGGGSGKRERPRSSRHNGNKARHRARPAQAESDEHATVQMARQLAAIVETHSLAELVLDTPEVTLTLRRGGWSPAGAGVGAGADAIQPTHSLATVLSAPVPAMSGRGEVDAGGPGRTGSSAVAAGAVDDDHHVVTSPFVGTFYRSPTPDSDPYVVEGQRVDKGQVLCIIEAMKLMNEIEADKAGVVVGVLVDNAQPVEYGQPLFKLAPV